MKTIDDKLDKLTEEVFNSTKNGVPLKLFIGEKIIESNDLVYKFFQRFRKKHEKKKKKKIETKEIKEPLTEIKTKQEKKLKKKKKKVEKKQEVTTGVTNLSLDRLSDLLKEVDEYNLENNY